MNELEPVINVYFEDIYENITGLLLNAKYSVKVCVAWISAPRLEKAFARLEDQGIHLEIIYDDSLSNENLRKFSKAKLYPISMDGSAFMHNKFCIIDDETLITGSFNWTYNASRSFENAIVINNDYMLIKSYLHEFEDLKNYSKLCNSKRRKRVIHADGTRCNSFAYNVGVFGYENSAQGTQDISIWNICNAHRIAECMGRITAEDNGTESFVEDDFDPSNFSRQAWRQSKDKMLEQFEFERASFAAPRQFLKGALNAEVHAYGFVRQKEQGFKATRSCDIEYCLELEWRHVYWRKIIPKKLYNDEGNISRIIERHSLDGFFGTW